MKNTEKSQRRASALAACNPISMAAATGAKVRRLRGRLPTLISRNAVVALALLGLGGASLLASGLVGEAAPTSQVSAMPDPGVNGGQHSFTWFEPGSGEYHARFMSPGTEARFHDRGVDFVLSATEPSGEPVVVEMIFKGSSPSIPRLEERHPGVSNYIVGADSLAWRAEVPHYARLTYQEVYDGIDVTFYMSDDGSLEYDFIVSPQSSLSSIGLKFDSETILDIDANGALVGIKGDERLVQTIPKIYQPSKNGPVDVAGDFVMTAEDTVAFNVPSYDPSVPLVVDPKIASSTAIPGTALQSGRQVGSDMEGNIYLGGRVRTAPSDQAYVAKFAPDGVTLLYYTVVGGSGFEFLNDLEVHAATGMVYAVGSTASTDFPVYQPPPGNQLLYLGGWGELEEFDAHSDLWGDDGFLFILHHDGSLYFSSYLGIPSPSTGLNYCFREGWDAQRHDAAYAIDLDEANAMVAIALATRDTSPPPGCSGSADVAVLQFPAPGLLASEPPGWEGDTAYYSPVHTWSIQGNPDRHEVPLDIETVDGVVFVGGWTTEGDVFPLIPDLSLGLNPLGLLTDEPDDSPNSYWGFNRNAIVMRFDASSDESWSITHQVTLGADGKMDAVTGLEVIGNVVIAVGGTETRGLVVEGVSTWGGNQAKTNAFMLELDAATLAPLGPELQFGGAGHDVAHSVAVGHDGAVHIVGYTESKNFIDGRPGDWFNPGLKGPSDGFLVKFASPVIAPGSTSDNPTSLWTPTPKDLRYAGLFGGSGKDFINGISLGPTGQVYMGGTTTSPDLFVSSGGTEPDVDDPDNLFDTGWDGFVATIAGVEAVIPPLPDVAASKVLMAIDIDDEPDLGPNAAQIIDCMGIFEGWADATACE